MGTGSHIPPSIGMGHKLNMSRGELLCSRRMRYLDLFAGEKAGGGGGLLLLSLLQGVRVLVYQHSARQSGRDVVVEILERGWCPPTMTVTGPGPQTERKRASCACMPWRTSKGACG